MRAVRKVRVYEQYVRSADQVILQARRGLRAARRERGARHEFRQVEPSLPAPIKAADLSGKISFKAPYRCNSLFNSPTITAF